MGTVTYKGKVHVGGGNFEWTYECTCVPRPVADIKVTSGNQNESEQLAQLACDEYCKTGIVPGSARGREKKT